MPELRFDHIDKTYPPARHVLENISLTVAAGECLALLGPSGCGKTTLLRIIAGLEHPTAGAVFIGDQNVTHLPSHLRDVAMLFQQPALVPTQSARHSLSWAWTLRKTWGLWRRTSNARAAELDHVARLLGLEHDLDRPVQELSGGEQQRVALGRCLLRRAPICLLDEPLAHLDAPLRVDLRRQIRALAREQSMTLIHVTHDPDEALTVGDRVAVMQEGRIVQLDEPSALARLPRNRYVAELTCRQQGGLNCLPGLLSWDSEGVLFEGPFGKWRVPERFAPKLLMCDKYQDPYPETDKLRIMLGVAASDVSCGDERTAADHEISLKLPMLQQENSPTGQWLIAGDSRGRWVGKAEGIWRGAEVNMTFSVSRAYWFDGITGQTLCAPAG